MRACVFASIVCALLAGAACAQDGAAKCIVLDSELQESYVGGCVNGYAEGRGEARGVAIYSGEFRRGRKHGQGVKSWPRTGDRYEGSFVDDRREGTGAYTWGRGSAWAGARYTGSYRADRRHGRGVYEWPNGERYAGPWENDAIAGAPNSAVLGRARTLAERAAAVAVAGTTVCRPVVIGIATEDRLRGTVLAREGDDIRVRIDDSGRLGDSLPEGPVRKGDVLVEPLTRWLPCRADSKP
jgi:hypothetical protein